MSNTRLKVGDEFGSISFDTWRAAAEAELRGAAFDKRLVTKLYEGVDVQPLYVADDLGRGRVDGSGAAVALARARHTGDTGPKVIQERREPTPRRASECIQEDLQLGVDGVRLRYGRALDVATSDDASAELGCRVHSVEQLEATLDGVDSGATMVSVDAGARFLAAATQLTQMWRKRGETPDRVHGAFNADILGTLSREGSVPGPLARGFDALASTVRLAEEWPHVTALCVASEPYHEAGANAAEDLAYTMASGLEYLRELDARGLAPSRVARQFVFAYSIGTEGFLMMAQLRAARVLWSRILEGCGVEEAESCAWLHAQMGKRALTRRDPWVNISRNTACLFAAIAGGADSVSSVPFDAALGLPSALARRIARNTPIILKQEAQVARVIDPAAGSFAIEKLTNDLAEKAWALMQEVERRGGMTRALLSGFIGERIAAGLTARLTNVATRRDVIVGVSEFVNANEPRPTCLAEDESHDHETPSALSSSCLTAGDPPPPLERLSSEHWGGSGTSVEATRLPMPMPARRLAAEFERLRDLSDEHLAARGIRPRVNLVNIGTFDQFNARATYARGFFEAGGFEVVAHGGSDNPEELAKLYAEGGGGVAVLCSSDACYEQMVQRVVVALRERGAQHIILAGNPGGLEVHYREAGIDRFIFVRCDVVTTLRDVLRMEGVRV